jgi:hypothetical protein
MIVNDPRDDELGDVPFKWIRAPEAEAARVRRVRAVAALVLVTASLSAGLVIGRFSTSLPMAAGQDQSASLKSADAPEHVPGGAPTGSRQPVASRPTMALTSEPALEVKTGPTQESSTSPAQPPESGPPLVLLNPGTAEKDRQQSGQPSSGNARAPKISSAPSLSSSEASREPVMRDKEAASRDKRESSNAGSARDYQALRNYVLGR